MLFFLVACTAAPDDTASPHDTAGDTADSASPETVDLSEELPAAPDQTWACRWLYSVAEAGPYTVVIDLDLAQNEDDRSDFSVEHTLGPTDSIIIGGGVGPGTLSTFDCSDVMMNAEGVHLWESTAATLQINATYLQDKPEWTCDGTSPNPMYDIEVTIVEASFADSEGATATLSDWGHYSLPVADYCGG
jgi:hypothetical protein